MSNYRVIFHIYTDCADRVCLGHVNVSFEDEKGNLLVIGGNVDWRGKLPPKPYSVVKDEKDRYKQGEAVRIDSREFTIDSDMYEYIKKCTTRLEGIHDTTYTWWPSSNMDLLDGWNCIKYANMVYHAITQNHFESFAYAFYSHDIDKLPFIFRMYLFPLGYNVIERWVREGMQPETWRGYFEDKYVADSLHEYYCEHHSLYGIEIYLEDKMAKEPAFTPERKRAALDSVRWLQNHD